MPNQRSLPGALSLSIPICPIRAGHCAGIGCKDFGYAAKDRHALLRMKSLKLFEVKAYGDIDAQGILERTHAVLKFGHFNGRKLALHHQYALSTASL